MKAFFRAFIKITGYPIYLLVVKPFIRKDRKGTKDKKKEGMIYISNHTSIFDYFVFIFTYFFKCLHTFAASILYRNIFMKFLLWVMECIKIDPKTINVNPLTKAEEMLNKGKTLLIFPEGHLEKKKGVLEEFKESAIILSFRTNCPIVVHYLDGRYSLFKRGGVMIGEKIYVRNLVNKDVLSKEDIEYVKKYLVKEVKRLKEKFELIKKKKTQTPFTPRYWVYDLTKITSFPLAFLVWNTKFVYLGDKRKVKEALKNNVLLAGNHRGSTDFIFVCLYIFSRRIRVICTDLMFKKKFLAWILKRCGAIKYDLHSNAQKFDFVGFKEGIDTLNANGAICIFPEGHITNLETMDNKLSPGLAAFSILTNSPIIPYYYVEKYRPFKRNVIVFGEPIYPQIGDKKLSVSKECVEEYNNYINEYFQKLVNKGGEYKCQTKK